MAKVGFTKRIRQTVLAWRRRTAQRLNRIRPKWLGGAGVWDFLVFFYDALRDRRFVLSAMGMAYRFFFAVFPALILILTVVPYVPVDDLQAKVMDFMGSLIPGDSMGFVGRVVGEFFDKPAASVIYINIALLLYASTSGIKAMMFAFSKESALFKKRNFFRLNAVAMMIFIVLLFLFLFMIGLLTSGEIFIDYLVRKEMVHDGIVENLLHFFHWVIVFVGIELAFSVLYYLGPETEERWKFFSPGSMSAGVLSLIAITLFRLFFTQFANYNKIYGSIGAVMVLMVWFYWLSIVLLIGFELNAAIAQAKFSHGLRLRKSEEEKEEEGPAEIKNEQA